MQQSIYHTFQRYRTLQTHHIKALPVAILMPHSACNCRCKMCDIWKGNNHLKQLQKADILHLLQTFRSLGTSQVLMSGGEALLHPLFFEFCNLLKQEGIAVTLHSTGLSLERHAEAVTAYVNKLIISLDGPEPIHDAIRNIPDAFAKLHKGISAIRAIKPDFPVSGRTVIHKHNFRHWPAIIDAAVTLGLDQISFLPADVTSTAFNRETVWTPGQQDSIQLSVTELSELQPIIQQLFSGYAGYFENRFIAESKEKIQKIADYYAALHGLIPFPYKRCNAPWVSVVVEADGSVRPCFFHQTIGNIRDSSLKTIINSEKAIHFRKTLNMEENDTCRRCVCSLYLSPISATR